MMISSMTSITLTNFVLRFQEEHPVWYPFHLIERSKYSKIRKEVCRNALIPHLATVRDLPVPVDFNVTLLCFLLAVHPRLDRQKEWVLLTCDASTDSPGSWWRIEQWMLSVASRPVPVLSRECSGLWCHSPLPAGCCGICPVPLRWEDTHMEQNMQGWFSKPSHQ